MRVSEHQRLSIDSVISRDSSLSVHPPTTKKPTRISVKTRSTQMSVIQEAELEFGSPKSPFFTSPVVRCTSPNPALECDGFQLCDDTDDAVPHVVRRVCLCLCLIKIIFLNICPSQIALGACKDAQVAWENDGESLTSVFNTFSGVRDVADIVLLAGFD